LNPAAGNVPIRLAFVALELSRVDFEQEDFPFLISDDGLNTEMEAVFVHGTDYIKKIGKGLADRLFDLFGRGRYPVL